MEKLSQLQSSKGLSNQKRTSLISSPKRPPAKLGYTPNGYILNLRNDPPVWITDSEAAQILAVLETAKFIHLRGGAYQVYDIRSILPHERKLTDDELKENALNFNPT